MSLYTTLAGLLFAGRVAPKPVVRENRTTEEPRPEPRSRQLDGLRVNGLASGAFADQRLIASPYRLPVYPPGVLPSGMAMDDATSSAIASMFDYGAAYGSLSYYHGLFAEGIGFQGYPYLSELSQRAEYRQAVEVFAEEMTRRWIKIAAESDDDKTDRVKELEDALDKFRVRDSFRKLVEADAYFGKGHLFLDYGNTSQDELRTRLTYKPEKIGKGMLRGIKPIDPLWTGPNRYSATDPTREDFYKPLSWFVMGREVDATRLLTIVSRPVPDMLKPAYAFGGLALTQLMKPYVDNWLRMRQSVADGVQAYSVFNLATDLTKYLQGGDGGPEAQRINDFVNMRNNRGVLLTDKEKEELSNVSAPLGSLDKLLAQSQEQMASVIGIPLVKYLGITPSGLNASSDGEIRVFYDHLHALQEKVLDDPLRIVIRLIQIDLWGEVDEDIDFEWVPLWELDETAKADMRKTNADTDAALVQVGAIDADEVRQRVAAELDSPYAGLDLTKPAPGPPMDPGMQGMFEGLGGMPVAEDPTAQVVAQALASQNEPEDDGGDDGAPPAPLGPPAIVPAATSYGAVLAGVLQGGPTWTRAEHTAPLPVQIDPLARVLVEGLTGRRMATDAWREEDHPRGQPENAGEFARIQGVHNTGRGSGAAVFVSPSVANHLDLPQAIAGLGSNRQRILAEASRDIDTALGLRSQDHGAIGAWSDGAENSVMTTVEGGSWDQLRVAAAMKGYIADQKACLVFQEAPEGSGAHLYAFQAQGSLEEIHRKLIEDGVEFHTLIPQNGGATVYVAALDGDITDAVERAAKRHSATVTVQHGRAEFIGAEAEGSDREQRDVSRAAYLAAINSSRVPGAATLWQRVHHAYGPKLDVTHDAAIDDAAWREEQHPRGQPENAGEFASVSGAKAKSGGSGRSRAAKSGNQRLAQAIAGGGRAAPQPSQPAPLSGPLPGSQGDPALVSSRRPTGAKAIEGDVYRRADLAGMMEDPKVYTANMELLRNANAYPNLRPEETQGTPDQIARAAIDHAKANLHFLYAAAPDELRSQAHLWYEGAHAIAADRAGKYGLPLASSAAVYAALSPQKLWDFNVYLGDRVMEIALRHQHEPWDENMDKTSQRIWKPKDQPVLDLIRGKTYAELTTPTEKAMWIRTYDETHSDRTFDRLSPDGRSLGKYYNDDGVTLSRGGWQSLPAIANAITALESGGDRNKISNALGARHKVRSFYNNILDPHSPNGDVTMDTHAVGAALLRPLTGMSAGVMHSLATGPDKGKQPPGWKGAASSAVTGSSGTYGLWADAYREAAQELGIEPRVLQSATWEAKRRLFDPKMKDATAAAVEQTWRDYHEGKLDLPTVQARVLQLAGGMEKPPSGAPRMTPHVNAPGWQARVLQEKPPSGTPRMTPNVNAPG